MNGLHLTLRARLTLVYGALFLVAGLVMLALTWALVQQQFTAAGSSQVVRQVGGVSSSGLPPGVEGPSGTAGQDGPIADYAIQVVDAARDDALTALLTQGALASRSSTGRSSSSPGS